MSQKNSFISMLEQIAVLNKNSVEIISKLSDVVGSKDSSITVKYLNNDGDQTQYQLPSVGYLKNEIEIANSNIKKLSGLDSETSIIINSNNSSKKIKSVELNREPNKITPLTSYIDKFSQNTNWFFENLINPLLTVKIDLGDKLDDSVTKILSKRHIVQFEKDLDGKYTNNGLSSKNDFETNFLYKNNVSILEFEKWLNNPTNIGVIKGNDSLYIDEDMFDVNYKEIQYKGYFSVIKYETDTLNNKIWYHINSIIYYDKNNNQKTLAVGDILATSKKTSYTKWRIVEVNISSSLYRLNLERIEGYDPLPIGTNVIEYYSPLTSNNNIKISIGFDEYNMIFLKSINTDNSIISSTWSNGISFYSNDLTLETDKNVSMSDFYLNTVSDYGSILKDMVEKQIPTKFASKPNIPELYPENFKVIQINKHLTDTKNYKNLKKLHSQKNSIKSRIGQINDSIIEKNKELNTKQFKSISERSKSHNELKELIIKQESDTKLYSSYVSQITNSVSDNSSLPKFRVRGFWDIPEPVRKEGSKLQEVIGFEIQWRYGSKFGTQNTTEGYEIKKDINGNILKKTGYFSEWNRLKTDIRKRTYDEINGQWVWEIEDISDADTPNINQLDLSIKQNEKVEVRIRSISEVGYPDSLIMSDWSEIQTIEFPDELSDVLGDSEFILKEASQEEVKVQFENELSAKGVNKHIQDSYYVNEEYVAHIDNSIATSFKDEFGNTISLYNYLKKLTDKISILEEKINRSKGEMKIIFYKNETEIELKNNSSILTNIELEDYMKPAINPNPSASYGHNTLDVQNNIYMIADFIIEIKNIAKDSPLGLLTNEEKVGDKKLTLATYIDTNGSIMQQKNNQFIYLEYYDTNKNILYSNIESLGNSGDTTTPPTVLIDNKNFNGVGNILDDNIWFTNGNTTTNLTNHYDWSLGSTIHPFLEKEVLIDKNNQNIHIIDGGDSFKIPINIYFKPSVQESTGIDIYIDKFQIPHTIEKKIRFIINPENSIRTFDFTLNFVLKRHRQYTMNDTKYQPETIVNLSSR